ncbi:hypothetical protein N431DRAFT_430365 [Stipitochalara longipes BDJ]|nr:hypothetical protein N431DRAFT_430365 [Stipitochalara longipes BDJ]
MEAVAGLSSIAGILSLAGQSVNGIIALRSFFQDCAAASHAVERFLKRLNELIQILEDVRELMKKLGDAPTKSIPDSVLASLQGQIDDCSKDIYKWLAMARKCHPASSSGSKASFKKFLVALEKQKITDIYVEIARYKNDITTILSTIGRHLDIVHSTALDLLTTKLAILSGERDPETRKTEASEVFPFLSSPYYAYSGQKSPGSSASIASIAESLARIESKMEDWTSTSLSRRGSRRGSRSGSVRSFGSAGMLLPSEHHETSSTFQPRESMGMHNVDASMSASPRQYTSAKYLPLNSKSFGWLPHWPHRPEDACLNSHYVHVTQQDPTRFVPEIAKYMDLILLGEATRFKIDLFRTTPAVLLGSSDEIVEKEIEVLAAEVSAIESEAEAVRLSAWKMGHDTQELDYHLALCRKIGPGVGPLAEPTPNEDDYPEKDIKKSNPSNSSLRPSTYMDANQQDRINMWLLNNLEASSEEKAHHRSFLTSEQDLDEEQWARLVLKYWWLDDAAVVREDESLSTNGAVDSGGNCHSVKIALQGNELSEVWESKESTGTYAYMTRHRPKER